MTVTLRVGGTGALLSAAVQRARTSSARLSLTHRFALFCLVILVAGAYVIGSWVAGEIERRVIDRTAAVTALYVDSFVRPHLGGLESGDLDAGEMEALGRLLTGTPLGREIVSFKVWSPVGEVLFAADASLIGERFPVEGHLREALRGSVNSHISSLGSAENRYERQVASRLVETYAPVRLDGGEVVGAVEFYQQPGPLLSQASASQRRGWLIVGASTVVMYLLLVGLVAGASRTITLQHRGLQAAFEEQRSLQGRIRDLNLRLRRAAAAKAETDEELMRRLAQDLHDGAAQDLSFALLRLESLRRPGATEEERRALSALGDALEHALEEIRDLSAEMRLPQLTGLGWREVVERAVADHCRRTGSLVHLETDDLGGEPSAQQRIAVYRVTQEALSNAARHSGTNEQWVSLRSEGGWCVVSVRDEGRGFEAGRQRAEKRRAQLGLQGMRERIELLGGSVEVVSSPGRGTKVVARLPLDGGEQA
jgi:signal transduction histidine kinase